MKDMLYKLFKDSKNSGKIMEMFTPEYIYKSLDDQIKTTGPIQKVLIQFTKAFYSVMYEKNIKPKNRDLTLSKKFLLYLEKPKKHEKSLPDLKFKVTVKNSVEKLLTQKKYEFNPSDINPEVTIGSFDDIIVNGELVGSVSVSIPMKPNKSKVYREDLLRNIECPSCSRSYGVYTIAFFCPYCGNQNLTAHFQKEKELIKKQIQTAYDLKEKDKELYYRLLGNVHEDTITLFETYLKSTFSFLAKRKNIVQNKLKTNTFQNLKNVKKFYKEILIDPFISITNDEQTNLENYIEVRHVIGHNLSMIDKKFIDASKSKFSNYVEGTTVPITESRVFQFITVCEKVIVFLEKEIKTTTEHNKNNFSFKSQKEELSDNLFELLKFSSSVKKSHSKKNKKHFT